MAKTSGYDFHVLLAGLDSPTTLLKQAFTFLTMAALWSFTGANFLSSLLYVPPQMNQTCSYRASLPFC